MEFTKQANPSRASGRKLWNPFDFIVVAAILLSALAIYYSFLSRTVPVDQVVAEIIMNGEIVKTVGLDQDMVFSVPEHPAVEFVIRDGWIAFQDSDCPDRICVHTGFIKEAGQTAVCLPNRIILKMTAPGRNDVPDTVA